MLILTDADAFGIDLDQLGEGILQTASDGDSAAQRDIQIRKLESRQFGSGVDRGAGLADHHLLGLTVGVELEHLGHQLVGFP